MTIEEAIKKLKDAGYDHREGQIEMMRCVDETITNSSIALIEGGTGIGKTFGYLIPALLNRIEGVRLVVATATISLQEQLAYNDLPQLQKILDIDFSIEVAKGRRRYVCLNRLYNFNNFAESGELALFGIETKPIKYGARQKLQIADLIEKYESRQWNGDADRLTKTIDNKLWLKISTDSAGCSAKRCMFCRNCPYLRAKRRCYRADVIVTNHDLLLSDISLGTGALLPKAADTIYFIDEAHHLPKKAIEHFASSSTLLGATLWLASMSKMLNKIQARFKIDKVLVKEVVHLSSKLKDDLLVLRNVIDANFSQFVQDNRWLIYELPFELKEFMTPIVVRAQNLSTVLTNIRKQLLATSEEFAAFNDFENAMMALAFFITKNHNLWRTWELFCTTLPANQSPIAKWIELKEADKKHQKYDGNDYVCHAAMTTGAASLIPYFWDKLSRGAILCSATLRALGSFDDYLEKSGLNYSDDVAKFVFLSPFAYEKSSLIIPDMASAPEGSKSQAHADEVVRCLANILGKEAKGVLVLFTSKWMLEHVYEAMEEARGEIILKQGDRPKHLILRKHKKQIDKGHASVIFGLQSFAEGIDLPGDYCRHVVITKLPFSVPSTPVEKTRVDWLQVIGRNAFLEHTLPEVSLKLIQYMGRLIRNENDTGTITILDKRLITKYYGKKILASLPKFKVQYYEATNQRKNN